MDLRQVVTVLLACSCGWLLQVQAQREIGDFDDQPMDGMNAAYLKDVIIEPNEASCGVVPSKSSLYNWFFKYRGYPDNLREQQLSLFVKQGGINCAKDCVFKTTNIPTPLTLKSAFKGAINCSIDEIPGSNLQTCSKELGVDNTNYGRTFVFNFTLSATPHYTVVPLLKQEDFGLSFVYGTKQLILSSPSSRKQIQVKFDANNRTEIVLHYDERIGVHLFANGAPSTLLEFEFIANNQTERKSQTVHLGALQVPAGCSFLVEKQCRAVGHSVFISKEVESIRTNGNNTYPDFSQCPDSFGALYAQIIQQYLCSYQYGICSTSGVTRRPCRQYCEDATRLLQLCPSMMESMAELHAFQCGQMNNSKKCVNSSQTESGLFEGTIENFKVYNALLDSRYLTGQKQLKNDGCLCGGEYPFYQQRSRLCSDFRRTNFESEANVGLEPGTQFFTKQYITDGAEEIGPQLSSYWASTPSVDPVSIIIDLKTNYLASQVHILLYSSPPKHGIVVSSRFNSKWKKWWYFVQNCSTLGLPNNGIPLEMDSIGCTEFTATVEPMNPARKKREVNPVPINPIHEGYRLRDFSFTFSGYSRPGISPGSRFLDKRLMSFMTLDALKVELLGAPISSGNSLNDDFHIVSEVQVIGNPVLPQSDSVVCEPNCFRGSREPEKSDSKCECICKEPFDRKLAGPQCVPYITSIFPAYGPIAGGTLIVLKGGLFTNTTNAVYLDSKPQPYLPRARQNCNIKFWNQTMIICSTSATSKGNIGQPFVVKADIGGLQIPAPELFYYKPNPELTSVFPRTSIVDGGVMLTINGEELESVAKPLMRVKVTYKPTNESKWTNYTLCTVQNNTEMQCPTPKLYPYLPEEYQKKLENDRTEINSSSPSPVRKKRNAPSSGNLLEIIKNVVSVICQKENIRVKRSGTQAEITINDDNLEFTLGFLLDGVPQYRDLEVDLPEFSKISVVVNPTLSKLSPFMHKFKPDWPHHETSISVQGSNMDRGAQLADYQIFVGKEKCIVTDLLSEGLFCDPPQDKPSTDGVASKDGALLVKLYVGNVNHILGYLKYYAWWQSTEFIVILVFLIIAILVLVAVAVYCYRRKTDPHYLTRKQKALHNAYIGVPNHDRPLLELIDSELRRQIEESLLRDSDNLLVGNEIGKGNFGKVYTGYLMDPVMRSKTHVAIKTIKGDSDKDSVEDFLKEAIVMKYFDHLNVLTLLGVTFKDNIPYVILPFMDNGDLKTYISNENNRFTVRQLVTFGLNIAKGMAYLEEQRFVHRDLAARNCMVDKEKNIKIADFGLARDIYVADYYRVEDRSRPLPIRWMAIESIELQKFTTKSDVWSFGVVLWELLSRGLKPYPGIDNLDIKRYLKRGDRMEKPSHSPVEVYELMKKCWDTMPDDRPSFKQLVFMLEELLQGKKQSDSPPSQRSEMARPDNDYLSMKPEDAQPADYLELVDMPTTESIVDGYHPMK